MREKIQAIVEECFSDQINEPCAYCTATDRLLALFTAETAAMREALTESEDIVDMFNRMLSERASDESIVSTLDSMIDRLGRKLEVLKGGTR